MISSIRDVTQKYEKKKKKKDDITESCDSKIRNYEKYLITNALMILIWNSTLEINVSNLHMIMQIYVTFCVFLTIVKIFFAHIIEYCRNFL